MHKPIVHTGKPGRPRQALDWRRDDELHERGLTVAERAKLHGLSESAFARRLRARREGRERDHEPAPVQGQGPGSDPAPEGPLTPEGRRARAQRAIASAYAEGGATALRAAGLDLDDLRRAERAESYVDVMSELEATAVRALAMRLGAVLRREAPPELVRGAASATASPEDREALAQWIDARPEIMREVVGLVEVSP